MYHFVMYNLSGIQKGIQAYHSGVEYSNKYSNDDNYKKWANEDKTVIILDGGGSNDMLDRMKELESFGIPFASFKEPDLNGATSAIAFLVEDDAYNYIKIYGDPTPEEEIIDRDYHIYQYLKSFKLAAN